MEGLPLRPRALEHIGNKGHDLQTCMKAMARRHGIEKNSTPLGAVLDLTTRPVATALHFKPDRGRARVIRYSVQTFKARQGQKLEMGRDRLTKSLQTPCQKHGIGDLRPWWGFRSWSVSVNGGGGGSGSSSGSTSGSSSK